MSSIAARLLGSQGAGGKRNAFGKCYLARKDATMKMLRHLSMTLFAILAPADFASAEHVAPFGLTWGPVDQIPKPSAIGREANVTTLFYDRQSWPVLGKDTEEILLEVCKREGLQEVVWLSRLLPSDASQTRHDAILGGGVRRNGKPVLVANRKLLFWPATQTYLGFSRETPEGRRVVMVIRGHDYAKCSEDHAVLTGHRLSDDAANFFSDGLPP